jgi:hypothetical protein
VRQGVLALLYIDPNAKLVKDTDIKRLGSKDVLPKVLEAQQAIDVVASKLEKAADKVRAAHVFGKFQSSVAALLMSKRSDYIDQILKKYKVEDLDKLKIENLQWLALEDEQARLPDGSKISDEFNMFALTIKPDEKSGVQPTQSEAAIWSGTGDVTTSILKEQGFSVGDIVTQTKGADDEVLTDDAKKVRWTIGKCRTGEVHLTSGDTTMSVKLQDFQNPGRKWKISKEVKVKILESNLPTIEQTKEHVFAVIKAAAMLAFEEARGEVHEPTASFRVHLQPQKGVELMTNVAKGVLILAPSTLCFNISEAPKKGRPTLWSSSKLYLGHIVLAEKTYWLYATGLTSTDAHLTWPCDDKKKSGLLAPFWDLKDTSYEIESNVILTEKLFDFRIQHEKIPQWIKSEIETSKLIKVPLVKTKHAIEAGSRLIIHNPKFSAEQAEPPAKKQKR